PELEASRLQDTAKVAARVASLVVVDDVMRAPQELVRRHGHEGPTAGLQILARLPEHGQIIVHVLDDVEPGGQIEARLRARDRRQRAAERVSGAAQPRGVEGERRSASPVSLNPSRERFERRPRAAADIENTRAGREPESLNHVLDDPLAGYTPP